MRPETTVDLLVANGWKQTCACLPVEHGLDFGSDLCPGLGAFLQYTNYNCML